MWLKRALLCTAFYLISSVAFAQCSICTKTAQQLGEGPAKGLNAGIIYLMLAPLTVAGVIGFKWWRRQG